MTAHKKPGAFLRALILHLDSEERRQLLDSLAKVEREGKCIRRAVFLMVVVFMISLAGLGYCAILLPGVFRSPAPIFVRSLLVLGLGSLISQVGFLGYLLWHRSEVTRLHQECRRMVLAVAGSERKLPDASSPGVHLLAQSSLNDHEDHL